MLLYSEPLVECLLRENGPSKATLGNILGFTHSHWLLLEAILLDMAEGEEIDPVGHNAGLWALYWRTVAKSLFTRLMSLARGVRDEIDTSTAYACLEDDGILTRAATFSLIVWNTPLTAINTFMRTTADVALLARQILQAFLESPPNQTPTPVVLPMDLASFYLWYTCKQVREAWGVRQNKVKRRAGGRDITKAVQRLTVRKADLGRVGELDRNLRKEIQSSTTVHEGQLETLRKQLEHQIHSRFSEQGRKFAGKIEAVQNYTDRRLKKVEEQQEGKQLDNRIKATDTLWNKLAQASAESRFQLTNIESMMKQLHMARDRPGSSTPPHSPLLGPIKLDKRGV